ncbi:MAG: 16S rRNA (cytosine(967)-C(5))-methyltransferase RsmB [Gammaproteobacteria bacterium]|nr:16S rRNA (cytosine(967)-C(5))-methyltransferase RsmB [Gammaproteobacteria bacterium]
MADATGGVARARAAELVDAVLTHGRNLDAAFAAADLQTLSERDRAFVKALSFGTLRVHARNERLLEQLLQRPLRRRDSVIHALLSVGLHALIDLEVADYATVSATVAATADLQRPKLRGLVNAVLRRFLREAPALLAATAVYPDARWQHPEWFIDAVQTDWPEHWQTILTAANQPPPMWLRINLRQGSRADWLAQWAALGEQASAPPVPRSAALLAAPAAVTRLPGFATGACSVQDAAAQLAAELLAPADGMRVLDACAAPGGKTGHLLEYAEVALTAVDSSPQRLARVRDNLQRLGLQAEVRTGDVCEPDGWWDGERFDRILLDAPCSATGVIRRHPDIRFLRRPSDIVEFAGRQAEMLVRLWPLLRAGGRLLYATCSIMRAENEAVVRGFLAAHSDAREVPLAARIPPEWQGSAGCGVQLLPGSGDTDGFYYALIERV